MILRDSFDIPINGFIVCMYYAALQSQLQRSDVIREQSFCCRIQPEGCNAMLSAIC